MQTKRLNNILKRQKRLLKLDVLLAVMFVVTLGFATIALVTSVPSMVQQSQDDHAQSAQAVDQSPAQITASILDDGPRFLVQ